MKGSSLVVGGVAAVLGAVVWAAIAYFTEYEIGWIAWGIGVGVGTAMVSTGARGSSPAVVAGALALASIGLGKLFVAQVVFDQTRAEIIANIPDADFDAAVEDAKLVQGLDRAELGEFMVERGHLEPGVAPEVVEAAVDFFEETDLPVLQEIHAGELSREEWKATLAERAMTLVGFASSFDLLQESLGPLDLLFAFLGVATAFGIVRKAEDEEAGGTGEATDSDAPAGQDPPAAQHPSAGQAPPADQDG